MSSGRLPIVIAIVGAGAAGLATAIFAVRRGVKQPVLLFEAPSGPARRSW